MPTPGKITNIYFTICVTAEACLAKSDSAYFVTTVETSFYTFLPFLHFY